MTKTTHSTSMNNDKGNIGIITNERQLENLEGDVTILFKVVDKLEKRIATLEKVLASHAKCIGEMREDKNDI
jgi:predicted  nucleic acid-binding Zn-ribbon protein